MLLCEFQLGKIFAQDFRIFSRYKSNSPIVLSESFVRNKELVTQCVVYSLHIMLFTFQSQDLRLEIFSSSLKLINFPL